VSKGSSLSRASRPRTDGRLLNGRHLCLHDSSNEAPRAGPGPAPYSETLVHALNKAAGGRRRPQACTVHLRPEAGGGRSLRVSVDSPASAVREWGPTLTALGGRAGTAISRDGKTIVGSALDGRGLENAAIWTGGKEWRVLGSFTPGARPCDTLLSGAFGASDDGKVVVGLGWGWTWTPAQGVQVVRF
jgi:hypothetical protein